MERDVYIQNLEMALADWKRAASAQSDNIIDLQRALNAERKQVKELERRLAEEHPGLDEACDQLATLQAQVADYKQSLNVLADHFDAEHDKVKDLQAQLRQAGEKYETLARARFGTKLAHPALEVFEENTALRQLVEALRPLIAEIKGEFDGCTHECERCGESDPLNTFDVYHTVVQAAAVAAQDAGVKHGDR